MNAQTIKYALSVWSYKSVSRVKPPDSRRTALFNYFDGVGGGGVYRIVLFVVFVVFVVLVVV
jgi:hypothetical protein